MNTIERAQRKFGKRYKEARGEFKKVKDKSLGKGLVRFIRGINQINKKLNIINTKVTNLGK
jgi:hypothetical protein